MPLKNGWTSGQYALLRCLLGVYLALHFAALLPWGPEVFSSAGMLADADASPIWRAFPNLLQVSDSPAAVTALLAVGVGASLLLAVGIQDGPAALAAWYVLACLLGRNPLVLNPGMPYVGWLLLAHGLCLAQREARKWSMPPALHTAAWLVLASGYSYSGVTKLDSPSWLDGSALRRVLENPLSRPGLWRDLMLGLPDGLLQAATWGALALEALFLPLALSKRCRPWIWAAMLGMHVSLLFLVDFADLTWGMILFHLFTFDPAWLPGSGVLRREAVFYDGDCGFCARSIRFLAEEDKEGVLVFAPLGGRLYRERLGDGPIPDSIVVVADEGQVLMGTAAWKHLLARLGGYWRLLSGALDLVPDRLGDRVYAIVAAHRKRLFFPDVCRPLPLKLRERFVR